VEAGRGERVHGDALLMKLYSSEDRSSALRAM
jgi:hypothetical protein